MPTASQHILLEPPITHATVGLVLSAVLVLCVLQLLLAEAKKHQSADLPELNYLTTVASLQVRGQYIVLVGWAITGFLCIGGVSPLSLGLFLVPFVLQQVLTQITLGTGQNVKSGYRRLLKITLQGKPAIATAQVNLMAVTFMYVLILGLMLL